MKGVSRKSLDDLMTSETRPDDERPGAYVYDPMKATHWTPLEAIVWIATRDADQVREVAPVFRQNWLIWKRVVQDYPYDERGNYSPVLPGTREARTRLKWRQRPIGPARFREEALRCADIRPARDELWARLSSGQLTASGLRGRIQFDGANYSLDDEALRPVTAARQEIRGHEWADLHPPGDAPRALSEGPMSLNESRALQAVRLFDREYDGPDVVRSARGVLYFDVRLPAREIVRTWQGHGVAVSDKKRVAVVDAIAHEGRQNLAGLSQKARESQVIDRVRGATGLSVSDRYVRKIWSEEV